MKENIFKSIADKKSNFKEFALKALDFKWISKEEFDAINLKLENDVLTIGVIGQMKCGKSTLLNALVYGEEVLPSATTPMTAALTVITYGKEKKIEAEFYTLNEWEELKLSSKRSMDESELDDNSKSKIKAAKEIIEKSLNIRSEIKNLLNTKKEDNINKLIDYVGADGKYVAITKSVKIFMPLDYLRGVEIVDTPGFNDPIVSREERTKSFLANADAVIMLLYAGRAFDAIDKDIIYNQLRSIGVGKLLIGVNKYDLCIENESENEIIYNVRKQLEQTSREYSNNSIVELVKERTPLLLSANMALMAKMNIKSISKNNNWGFYYKKASDIFGISSQKEMLEKSLFPEFEKALMQIIFGSKDEILLKKPINTIKQKGENKHVGLINNIIQTSNRLTVLNKPDSEREDLLNNTTRSKKKIKRKVDNFEIEIDEILRKGITDLTLKTEDLIYDYKKDCKNIIEDHGLILNKDNLENKLESKIDDFEIELKRLFVRDNTELNLKLKKEIKHFLSEVDEIAEKYDEDFDVQDYLTSCKRALSGDILNLTFKDLLPSTGEENTEESFWEVAFVLSTAFFNGATFGIISGAANTTQNVIVGKKNARERIDYFFSILDLNKIEKEITRNGIILKDGVQRKFIDDFLAPIIVHLNEINRDKKNRDIEILENKDKLTKLEIDKKKLEKELMEMEVI